MRKDIRIAKFIVGCAFMASFFILFGAIGGSEVDTLTNAECFRNGITALALMGIAYVANKLLDKEKAKNEQVTRK